MMIFSQTLFNCSGLLDDDSWGQIRQHHSNNHANTKSHSKQEQLGTLQRISAHVCSRNTIFPTAVPPQWTVRCSLFNPFINVLVLLCSFFSHFVSVQPESAAPDQTADAKRIRRLFCNKQHHNTGLCKLILLCYSIACFRKERFLHFVRVKGRNGKLTRHLLCLGR